MHSYLFNKEKKKAVQASPVSLKLRFNQVQPKLFYPGAIITFLLLKAAKTTNGWQTRPILQIGEILTANSVPDSNFLSLFKNVFEVIWKKRRI